MSDGYKTQSLDTEREIEERLFAAYRLMTPAQKLHRWSDLRESTFEILRAAIRSRQPELDPERAEFEFVRRIVGDELADRIHGRRQACAKPPESS